MKKQLSLVSYMVIGSMLFGLFFGAGNLIFPVHLGQAAGGNVWFATLGFLLTGVGLPFLGIIAIGFSNSNGLYDLASRVHPVYGLFLTLLLYLTIGPFFALPRTATVSFEIGLAPYFSTEHQQLALFVFTGLFFILAWLFSLNPSKIMVWVGKILNPLFLVFLALLIAKAFMDPMGRVAGTATQENYLTQPFFTGFIEGYNTMDTLAALAFGIIVVSSLKNLGVTQPKDIAKDTFKSGFITLILMSIIYGSLAYMGATSIAKFPLSENGGIALTQIAHHYFGSFGSILLAIIVTLACLKTGIGLITACSETFNELFPKLSYRTYVHIFSLMGAAIANVGLTSIIQLSLPVLMFLYPLAITLIILALLSPLFHHQAIVYQVTTGLTFFVSIFDGLKAAPPLICQNPLIASLTQGVDRLLPFSKMGMGWLLPACIGLAIGWSISLVAPSSKAT